LRVIALALPVALGIAATMVTPPAARATTTVQLNANSIVLNPKAAPSGQTDSVVAASAVRVVVQRAPQTQVINKIVLGDLARDGACSSAPPLRLYVRNDPTGNPDTATQANYSSDTRTPSATVGPLTWTLPPMTLLAGHAYVFHLASEGTCQTVKVRNWAHNATAVNSPLRLDVPGSSRCGDGPHVTPNGTRVAGKFWHDSGTAVISCPYLGDLAPATLDASLASGWYVASCAGAFAGGCLVGSSHVTPLPQGVTAPNPCDGYAGMGTMSQFWRSIPLGGVSSMVENKCRWTQWLPPTFTDPDGWYYAEPWLGGQGAEPRDMYLAASLDGAAAAAFFRPKVLFDSGERFRPLNIPAFLSEVSGSTGVHRVCDDGTCWTVSGTGTLNAHRSSTAKLDIAGTTNSDGTNDGYQTTKVSCIVGVLRDCDSDTAKTAIYWAIQGPSPGGYRYLDYWLFYRYNDLPPGSHEGDWEHITIAPSRLKAGTFDFATFSQHERRANYLRGTLRCDGGGGGTCGSEVSPSGRRVSSFVARGSHANYPYPCSSLCLGPVLPESHDGGAPWGADNVSAVLKPISGVGSCGPSGGSWIDWPGRWGSEAQPLSDNPRSPACRSVFFQPWLAGENDCAENNCALPATRRASAGVSKCESWLGSGIRLAVCAPDKLRAALRRGSLGDEPLVRLSRHVDAWHATTAVGQMTGAPLRPGTSVTFRVSRSATRLIVLARIRDGRRPHEARLAVGPVRRGETVRLLTTRRGLRVIRAP
jgi:hypothetical protein